VIKTITMKKTDANKHARARIYMYIHIHVYYSVRSAFDFVFAFQMRICISNICLKYGYRYGRYKNIHHIRIYRICLNAHMFQLH